MEYSYECSICGRSMKSAFFMCSNCHITCIRCCLSSTTTCRLCGLGQVYCCEFTKYRLDESNGLLFRRSSGPVVVLPVSKESVRTTTDHSGDHYCESNGPNCVPCFSTLMSCFDCRKCVFQSRVLEHYVNEHKDTLICPVPPGSMVAFKIHSRDFKLNKMRKLVVLQLMDISEATSSAEDDGVASEGDEKLFFVMGCSVPFCPGRNSTSEMIKLWVFATFHACNTNYSLEVTGPADNGGAIIFTGVPINGSSTRISVDSLGRVVHVRRSLVEHLENNGGCTVNIYVHHNGAI